MKTLLDPADRLAVAERLGRPEADQEQGGTPPREFVADLAALRAARDRFLAQLDLVAARPHYLFGPLSRSEWARWGYLHMDHHLRQFGA